MKKKPIIILLSFCMYIVSPIVNGWPLIFYQWWKFAVS